MLLWGYTTICETINENPNSSAADIRTFLNTSFDEPDRQDRSLHNRWMVRVAIYKVLLYTAGFDSGGNYKVSFPANENVKQIVDPNILANTENWFVSHINSEREIRELAKFYDFSDFSKSLLRSQDVGFSRVKTLSSPFVVPIQIDKFDPERIKHERILQ